MRRKHCEFCDTRIPEGCYWTMTFWFFAKKAMDRIRTYSMHVCDKCRFSKVGKKRFKAMNERVSKPSRINRY